MKNKEDIKMTGYNIVWQHATEEIWIERREDGKYYAIDTSGCQYRRGWEAGIITITDTIDAAIAAASVACRKGRQVTKKAK